MGSGGLCGLFFGMQKNFQKTFAARDVDPGAAD